MSEPKGKATRKRIAVPIEWQASTVPTVFANQVMVQSTEHECYLSFYEVRPPLAAGLPGNERQLEALTTIPAYCVARVVVTPHVFARLSEAIDSTVEQRKEKDSPIGDEPEAEEGI